MKKILFILLFSTTLSAFASNVYSGAVAGAIVGASAANYHNNQTEQETIKEFNRCKNPNYTANLYKNCLNGHGNVYVFRSANADERKQYCTALRDYKTKQCSILLGEIIPTDVASARNPDNYKTVTYTVTFTVTIVAFLLFVAFLSTH